MNGMSGARGIWPEGARADGEQPRGEGNQTDEEQQVLRKFRGDIKLEDRHMADKEIIMVRERLTGLLCYSISNFRKSSLFKEIQSQR